jgi:hypothetical protein
LSLIESEVRLVGADEVLRRLNDPPVKFEDAVGGVAEMFGYQLRIGVKADTDESMLPALYGKKLFAEGHDE